MPTTIIHVENISKRYQLGVINSNTLKEDIAHWWRKNTFRGPATGQALEEPAAATEFWALRDVHFKVANGEILGLIGNNGAGKSTLLKILSRVTRPTNGRIVGEGRVASLLEVGTGFHDDLTGKENIFLNGNILGMRNWEIRKKLDQIIAFSGIEKFIETPVKRYSSGMYVRLAFAVAAHLDPEILIVDEVLAVGDAEFQKKCLGKISNIATNEGTTVIMVSHNMQAVQNLCSRALLMEAGKLVDDGEPSSIIANYTRQNAKHHLGDQWNTQESAPGNNHIRMKKVLLKPEFLQGQLHIDIRTPLRISIEFVNLHQDQHLCVGIHLFTNLGDCIFDISSIPQPLKAGVFQVETLIPGNFLNDGSYYLSVIFVKDTSIPLFYLEECISFEVADFRENYSWFGKWMGHVRPQFPVLITPLT